MKPRSLRLVAMSSRVLAAVLATLSVVAFAQSEEYSPPPMVPVDPPAEATPDQPPLVPQSGQPVQPIPADPQQQQPDQQQPQYPQQPQYQPYPQQQQYGQPQPQRPAKPAKEPVFAGTPFESTRSKHFLAMASASPAVFAEQLGSFALNVRAEADIGRIPLFVGYTGFFPITLPRGESISHFTAMTGWSFFSSDEVTWRALTGVDVINDGGLVGTGVVFGSTFRAMANSVGFDAAVMFTPFPFRQLELRAAFVVQFWRVFELQLGWRYQAIDATQGGDLGTLFNIAPAANGPAIGLGLTF